MNCRREDLLLYALTDRAWLSEPTVEAMAGQAGLALRGGVTMLQLREKDLDEEEFLREAYEVRALCARYDVPLIINDRVDIALAVDAAGVHLGQSDTGIPAARAALGPEKIIGASARTVEQALRAEEQGADYLGVGAVFPTATKKDAEEISLGTLSDICGAVSVPVAAIGGITADNAAGLAGTGIAGIAVIGAVFGQEDVEAAARRMRGLAQDLFG